MITKLDWDHSFSTFVQFAEKLTFLTPATRVSGGKKCRFFERSSLGTK